MSTPVYSYALYRNAGLRGAQPLVIPEGWTFVVRQISAYMDLTTTPITVQPRVFLRDGGTTAVLWETTLKQGDRDFPILYAQDDVRFVFGSLSEVIIASYDYPADCYVGGYLLHGQAPIQIVGSPAP